MMASRVDISELNIRMSIETDINGIDELVQSCFGKRDDAVKDIAGRYLLAFDGDRLVAMTGLSSISDTGYDYEVDWTCTHPDYQGNGIMTYLLNRVVEGCDSSIAYLAWRRNDEEAQVANVLKRCGFKLKCRAYKERHNASCRSKQKCIYYSTCGSCYEDLYVKHPC